MGQRKAAETSTAMERLLRIARMLQPILLAMAILLAGVGFYYFHYLPGRQEAQAERLFRHLNEMSEQMAGKIDNLTNALSSAATATLTGGGSADGRVPAFARRAFWTGVEAFVPPLTIFPPPAFNVEPIEGDRGKQTLLLRADRLGNQVPLTCQLSWELNGLLLQAEVSADLPSLIAPIIARHEFQGILLVDAQGRVLVQSGNSVPALQRLPRLMPQSGSQRSGTTNHLDLTETVVATRARAELAGRPFVFFLQPMNLPLASGNAAADPPDSAHPKNWFLTGVIDEQELGSRARPLPYFVVFGFCAAVVLMAILLPFLHIVTGGKQSQIRSHHVVFLISAALAGSGGLVIVSSHMAQHWHQETQIDRGLEELAGQIQGSFQAEVTNTVAWLAGFTPEVVRNTSLDSTNMLTRLKEDPFWRSPAGQRFPPMPAGLRLVHWLRPNGEQAVKWSTAASITPRIRIKDRLYLDGILSGQTYPKDRATEEYPVAARFILEPIHSRLRAENVLACSIAAPTAILAGFTNLGVVCAEFQPASLMETLLPPGFHFAVVDSQGQVLFHSDGRRNLRENLLEECDHDPRLRAALEGRGTDTLVVDYYQRRHHLHLSPLTGLPWTLMVLREHRFLDSIRASQATTTLMVLLAAGFLLVVVLWAAAAMRRVATGASEGLPRWLWPNQACLPLYLVFSLINGVILLGAFVGEFLQRPLSHHHGLFLVLFWSGPLWVLVSCRQLGRRSRQTAGRQTLSTRTDQRRYVSWLATTLVVLVIPSALAVHRVIAEIEAERFIRWTQGRLAEALEPRLAGHTNPVMFLDAFRTGNYGPVFLDTQFRWRPSTEADPAGTVDRNSLFDRAVHTLRYDFQDPEDIGVKMHGWGAHAAADGHWWSRRQDDRSELYRRVWHPTAGAGVLALSSRSFTFPTIGGTAGWVCISLLGGLLGLLAAWLAASFIASRVLLLRHVILDATPLPSLLVAVCESPEAGTSDEESTDSPSTRSFVLSELRRLHRLCLPLNGPGVTDPGAIEILDWRGRMDAPDDDTLEQLVRSAVEGNRQVVVLVSSDALLAPFACRGAILAASTWRLPRQGDISEALLTALQTEYERRWKTCSAKERRVLWEVARTGYEDAENPAVTGLLQRGLLRLDPNLRLPGRSWRRFILRVAPLEPPPEAEASESSWPVVRTLLIVAGLGIMAFLMLTQPETWQRTTGVLAGLLAGFKLMGDFFGAVRKEATGPAPSK